MCPMAAYFRHYNPIHQLNNLYAGKEPILQASTNPWIVMKKVIVTGSNKENKSVTQTDKNCTNIIIFISSIIGIPFFITSKIKRTSRIKRTISSQDIASMFSLIYRPLPFSSSIS